MKQEAILMTRLNIDQIAAQLTEYTVEELLEEFEEMLEAQHTLVLARDVLDSGFACISYVVWPSMFKANNPGIKLNDKHFTHVRDV